MKEWNAGYDGTRAFGYAFAELFLREYVKERGIEALHSALRKLADVNRDVSSAEEFSEIVLKALGTELEPCRRKTEKEMLECITALNRFNPKIPHASILKLGISRKESSIAFDMESIRRKNLEERFSSLKGSILGFLRELIKATEAIVG